jgi:hypothetical protein
VVPCLYGMACLQVADGEELHICGVATNVVNKQPRTADKG